MTASPPRRPWWKRKRTWAALAIWFALSYALSRGPAVYAVARGWLPGPYYRAIYRPAGALLPRPRIGVEATLVRINGRRFSARPVRASDPPTSWYYRYVDWCRDIGYRHAASD